MEDTNRKRCTHRWVLGEPTINTVSGVCRKCGRRRTYPSVLEMYQAAPDYVELENKHIVQSFELVASGEGTQG